MGKGFGEFAQKISDGTGSSGAFVIAASITIAWLLTGPLFHFSDTWQLIISTISSAVTFLMVFIIQYSQNKDTKALQIKLDELIRANKNASNDFVKIEKKPKEKLEEKIEEVTEEIEGNPK